MRIGPNKQECGYLGRGSRILSKGPDPNRGLALADGHVGQIFRAFVDLLRPDKPVVVELLDGVGRVAGYPRGYEDGGVEVDWDAEEIGGVAGWEIDVREDVLPLSHGVLED